MANKYDMVSISIGYNRYVMPYMAAKALFEAFRGGEIYKVNSEYANGESYLTIQPVPDEGMPTMAVMGPVQFHAGILRGDEAARKKNAEEAEKRRIKALEASVKA